MTSLPVLSRPGAPGARSAADGRPIGGPRPLSPIALLGGGAAAGATLVVCLAVGVLGWFVSDAGTHGEPRDGLRVAALGWLSAHGSGVSVAGVPVTAVPLGLSVLCAWVVWRLAWRVGDLLSGHGPDADRIADGERDWTVPAAGLWFAVGYAGVASTTLVLAGTPLTGPSLPGTLGWCLGLSALVALPALAVGSGRAAIWVAALPATLLAAIEVTRRLLVWWLLLSTAVVASALLLDLSTAANVLAQLHTSLGEAVLVSALCLLLVPNAVLLAGAYLLGAGFAVGAGTVVSPTAVALGPVPMLPLMAALPDAGPTPWWTPWLVASPFLVAAGAAARVERVRPAARFDEAAVRGAVGGVLAGLVVGLLATLAGGSVGPGRMRVVGPDVLDMTLHAVTAFGLGGLLGALVVVGWRRWGSRPPGLGRGGCGRQAAPASAESGAEAD